MLLLLENIRERLTLIALTAEEYHATIKEAAEDTLKTFGRQKHPSYKLSCHRLRDLPFADWRFSESPFIETTLRSGKSTLTNYPRLIAQINKQCFVI
jgi:hypothetical protein